MKVEILYFSGCPNYHPAVARLSDILRQEAASAELVEVEIKDADTAQVMGFLGSPSIRINGRDVEPTAHLVLDDHNLDDDESDEEAGA